MRPKSQVAWTDDPRRAIEVQREFAGRVIEQDEFAHVERIAGVDVGFEGENKDLARAAVVILRFPELTVIESSIARRPVAFPYVPGLLAFREAPVVLDALAQVKHDPDMLIVDGQGRAHPRRLGIASHLGVLLDCPAIGCAKSRLIGEFRMPGQKVGASAPLMDGRKQIGVVLRTREKANPLFISVGHRVSLKTAVKFVLECLRGYRLPEPTRLAHHVASGGVIDLSEKPNQPSLFD